MKNLIITLTFLLFALNAYSTSCASDTIFKKHILLTTDEEWEKRNHKDSSKDGAINVDCYLTNYGISVSSDFSQQWQYCITNMRNQTIVEGSVSSQTTIPTKALRDGTYVLYIYNTEYLYQGLFTIED